MSRQGSLTDPHPGVRANTLDTLAALVVADAFDFRGAMKAAIRCGALEIVMKKGGQSATRLAHLLDKIEPLPSPRQVASEEAMVALSQSFCRLLASGAVGLSILEMEVQLLMREEATGESKEEGEGSDSLLALEQQKLEMLRSAVVASVECLWELAFHANDDIAQWAIRGLSAYPPWVLGFTNAAVGGSYDGSGNDKARIAAWSPVQSDPETKRVPSTSEEVLQFFESRPIYFRDDGRMETTSTLACVLALVKRFAARVSFVSTDAVRQHCCRYLSASSPLKGFPRSLRKLFHLATTASHASVAATGHSMPQEDQQGKSFEAVAAHVSRVLGKRPAGVHTSLKCFPAAGSLWKQFSSSVLTPASLAPSRSLQTLALTCLFQPMKTTQSEGHTSEESFSSLQAALPFLLNNSRAEEIMNASVLRSTSLISSREDSGRRSAAAFVASLSLQLNGWLMLGRRLALEAYPVSSAGTDAGDSAYSQVSDTFSQLVQPLAEVFMRSGLKLQSSRFPAERANARPIPDSFIVAEEPQLANALLCLAGLTVGMPVAEPGTPVCAAVEDIVVDVLEVFLQLIHQVTALPAAVNTRGGPTASCFSALWASD